MNYKLKGNIMLNGDIISPEIPIAEFSDELISSQKHRIVITLNHGHEMLMLYKQLRENMHIVFVTEMLTKMEDVFSKYDYAMFELSKKG
jgi:hypothetical protein